MTLRFVGTTEISIDPDPKEYVGKRVDQVAQELQQLLEEVAPTVDVPFNDIVMAADELVTAACGS